MNDILSQLGLTACSMMLGIVFHELGHMIVYKLITKKTPVVSFQNKKDFVMNTKGVNREQYILIVVGGIIAGFLGAGIFANYLNFWLFGFVMLFYITGCSYDIKAVIKTMRKQKNNTV